MDPGEQEVRRQVPRRRQQGGGQGGRRDHLDERRPGSSSSTRTASRASSCAPTRSALHSREESGKDKDGKEHDFEYLVAMKDGKPVAVDPERREERRSTGDLFVDRPRSSGDQGEERPADRARMRPHAKTHRGMRRTSAASSAKDIEADGAGAHQPRQEGRRRRAPRHRPAHERLLQRDLGLMTINLLLGNFDWKGGMIAASTYNSDGQQGRDSPSTSAR
ncbi:MAG: hypothetical protein MZW92_25540 [Comamonadaceae bacterium]|nr:hypothetical protein [Comamonadaceae bacterium]